jgi:uncharacterized membrane protein YcaP (DUF421 family)
MRCLVNTILTTLLRTVAIYAMALLFARLMERKLISQMTFFDFVVGVSLGSLAANAMIGAQRQAEATISALIILSLLSITLSYLNIKSLRIRKVINSEPVTLVQNGTIVEENMKNIRLTVNELMMKLREKNAFCLADVEFAIMETDGQMSVLPKADKKPLTPSQMNIQAVSTGLTRDIIIDGVLLEENLKSTGLDAKWVNSQLNSQNIKDISEVFYAGMDNSKNLYISKKSANKKEEHGKYGIE